jgi:hypothetical protein
LPIRVPIGGEARIKQISGMLASVSSRFERKFSPFESPKLSQSIRSSFDAGLWTLTD